MKRIPIVSYFQIGLSIQTLVEVGEKERMSGSRSVMRPEAKNSVSQHLNTISQALGFVDMRNSQAQAAHIRARIAENPNITWEMVAELFGSLSAACATEMDSVFAGYIPQSRAHFWAQQRPFGDSVYERFPSAREDLTAAGNCYAVEQYTACIFHCMRVAEKGLRALARDCRIKTIKDKPLEWNDWGHILRALEIEAHKLASSLKPGPKRDKALEFYRDAAGELYGFKDAYRNYVTHDRATYDMNQASSVFHRVGAFMQRLSRHLDEASPKKIKWT